MDNKSDGQLLIMQATIDANRQDSDEKMKNLTEYLTEIIVSMMDQIKFSKSSPEKQYEPNDQDSTTVVLNNQRVPPLEGGHYTKNVLCGISNMRSDHQIL